MGKDGMNTMGINPYDWYERGLEIRDLNERLIYFRSGLGDKMLHAWASHGIGFLLLAQNDINGYREIIKNVDKIQVEEDYVSDWECLGDDLLKQGKHSSAIEAYFRALDGDYWNQKILEKFLSLTALNFPEEDLVLDGALPNHPRKLKLILASLAKTQDAILRALAKDPDYLARRAVGLNQNAPIGLIEALAKDPNPCVKFGILDNPSCPPALKKELGRELRDAILRLYDFDLDKCLKYFHREGEDVTEIWFYKISSPMESQNAFESHLDGWLSVEFVYHKERFNQTRVFLRLRTDFGNYLSIKISNFEEARFSKIFTDLSFEYLSNNYLLAGDELFDSLRLIPKSEQVAWVYEIIQTTLKRKRTKGSLHILGDWQEVQALLQKKEFIKNLTHSNWKHIFCDCVANLLYEHPEEQDLRVHSEILEEIKVIQHFATIPLTEQSRNRDPLQRSYYISTWGFDPLNDWIPIPSGLVRYEARFLPLSDPNLQAAGIEIFARVDFHPENHQVIHNSIAFRDVSTLREGAVDCTHTIVYKGPGETALALVNDNGLKNSLFFDESQRHGRDNQLILTPEEHFVALKSYVAAIVETGIIKLLRQVPTNQNNLPFGFNSDMQRQVLVALGKAVPETTFSLISDLLLELIEENSEAWVISRAELLKNCFGPILKDVLNTLIKNGENPIKNVCLKLLQNIGSE